MLDLYNEFLTYASTEAGERAIMVSLAVLAVIGAILLWVFGVLGKLINFLKPKQTEDPTPTAPAGYTLLTTDEFVAKLEQEREKTEAKLKTAHDDEKAQLQLKLQELERRIANPEEELKKAQARIKDLEVLLDRESNEIGSERIDAAKDALRIGNYTLADEIFAEIEARTELELQQTARAAFGRGEVAEAEIRWLDAAQHYAKAARLDPSPEALAKASQYVHRAGDYKTAARFSSDYVDFARALQDDEKLSSALNEHAANLWKLSRLSEAEDLFREKLALDENIGSKTTETYASGLNNLALVFCAQGRYPEAETLYREALEVAGKTIGAEHSDYAMCLNNLAEVVREQGRYPEAEALYRESLEIDRNTIGAEHPHYAIHLNNLALVVQAQGRYPEAETLYREALEIGRNTIGDEHPDYAIRLGNLGDLLGQTDRVEEGRAMLQQALPIFEASLPEDHPHIATAKQYLANLDAQPTEA